MHPLVRWFHRFGSPPTFYRWAGAAQPWLLGASLLIGGVGLYLGLAVAPADYLQGESVRILYIHVPSAWMSLFVYLFVAANAFVALVWRIRISEILAMAAVPIGAMFTAVTLATGSLWGRPTWGTYWQWDARLTSEPVLLFLYIGVLALFHAIEDRRRAARAAGLLALVGVVNLPIIHYSVRWWNTLHQGESVSLFGQSSMHSSMLWPLLLMALATHIWFFASLAGRARLALLEADSDKAWVRAALRSGSMQPPASPLSPAQAPSA